MLNIHSDLMPCFVCLFFFCMSVCMSGQTIRKLQMPGSRKRTTENYVNSRPVLPIIRSTRSIFESSGMLSRREEEEFDGGRPRTALTIDELCLLILN